MPRRSAADAPAARDPKPDAGSDAAPDAQPIDIERPSKTALKKQAHQLQQLGAALAALPDARLAAAPLDDGLRAAVLELRRTRSHEGRRRQLQFVGKLMRASDVEPLREAVAAHALGGARDALALHQAERWRAELAADDQAQERWMAEHPASDRQQLRALVRAARKDGALPAEQRHGRAWRELFRFIRQHQAQAAGDAAREGGHDGPQEAGDADDDRRD